MFLNLISVSHVFQNLGAIQNYIYRAYLILNFICGSGLAKSTCFKNYMEIKLTVNHTLSIIQIRLGIFIN